MNILLVEDDVSLNRGLSFALKKEGFYVVEASCIREAEKIYEDENIDLIILDVNLPDGNGFDFCISLRRTSEVPIIFLTAQNTELDISNGLDMGGDDYIAKPFSIKILISRVNAILRRMSKENKEKIIVSNKITVDEILMKVKKDEEEIFLSKKEFLLLKYLMKNSKQVLSKDQILSAIWEGDIEYIDSNVVPVNIKRLREKIEKDYKNPEYIKNVRGVGYIWAYGCSTL